MQRRVRAGSSSASTDATKQSANSTSATAVHQPHRVGTVKSCDDWSMLTGRFSLDTGSMMPACTMLSTAGADATVALRAMTAFAALEAACADMEISDLGA